MYAYIKLNIKLKPQNLLAPTKPKIPQNVKHSFEQHAHERPWVEAP